MGRYALLVAANDYEDSYFEQLRSPAQDVRGLAAVLEDPAIGGFDVTVLENAADHEVRRMLDEMTSDRQPDDMVLVYFSCHGLQDMQGRLHFATTTTWAQRPASTAVAASFVSDCLERTAAAGRLLLLDCCYSGSFARGFAKTSPRPLDGEISRGYVCLTACNEYELAYEGESVVVDEPRPSVFTEVVIEGLRTGAADLDRDGWIESGELHRYAFDEVRKASRQTPSYFAAGLQAPLMVARSAGRPVGIRRYATVVPAAAMARTPRFFAARFPPFHFAREDRATPTHLAEAMARHRDQAVALFRADEARSALHEWISQDVRDRNLERTILRRAPEDETVAGAAVSTFIATFAPHLPPCFDDIEISIADLVGLAHRAADGDEAARASVSRLYRHNMLRTFSRHNCREDSHHCGPGKACAVLRTAAERWDELVPAATAAVADLPPRLHPAEPAIVAQLLAMILDAAAMQVPLGLAGAQRDMPTWWLRLILTARVPADSAGYENARVAQLALAVLTHDAARAERDEVRRQETGRDKSLEAGNAEPVALPEAARSGRLSRLLPMVGFPALAIAVAVMISAIAADHWWRTTGSVPEIYDFGLGYSGPAGLTGLLFTSPLVATVAVTHWVRRRRWFRAGLAAFTAVVLAWSAASVVPGLRELWLHHAHDRAVHYAEVHDIAVDEHDRPIQAQCGIQRSGDNDDVVLALDGKVKTGCRTASVYLRGRRTGTLTLPADTQWTTASRFWFTSSDDTGVLVVAGWVPDRRDWRLIAVMVGYPDFGVWTRDLDSAGTTSTQLKAIRWSGVVAFPSRTDVYAIGLSTGQTVWHRSCSAGRKFNGLGGAHPDGVGVLCDQEEVVYRS
ncbi:hypothetical protein BJ973_009667 [Actinoplanes tereljensis]|uniref:Peptidase C14 caspase domain-containing protein n=1 Tax=Paractinoplanes tereljensis TaxID=571912 RepID=A0A919NF01_9ACTN|nr:caspase family protein [Actinoplanes tereljensis]GIF17371.1 hypothetical protein Ate02nite_01010 [Actinoplanes tereljensis]